jgi:alpha-glucosidase
MNSSPQPTETEPITLDDPAPAQEAVIEAADCSIAEGPALAQINPDAEPVRGVTGAYFNRLAEMTSWEQTPTGITARVDDSRLDLDFVDPDVLRVAVTPLGRPAAPPTFVVDRDTSSWKSAFTVKESETEIRLTTPEMRVVIAKAPFAIEAFRPDGSAIAECASGNDLGSYATLNDEFIVTRKRAAGSSILGLGQKTGRLDRSGRDYILWNTDVLNPRALLEFGNAFKPGDPRRDPRSQEFDPYYISIPFYYSLDSHGRAAGFFIDNLHRAQFDFSHAGETRIRFAGGAYVEYVFAGPNLPTILQRYTELTGRMMPPPIWSLGYHHCRWHPYRAADVIRHAKRYREREIPCDSIWLDIDHMNGYRVFTWNKTLFPNPRETLGELGRLGFRAVTIVDPGVKVEIGNPVYEDGLKKNAFCLTEGGTVYQGQVWPGRTAFPDFANEEARGWWGDLNAKHVSVGLSGIWNDMNEPATGDVPDAAMRFDRGKYSHGAYHNGYALLMAMATYQGLRKAMPDSRPFILSRAGCAGIQRYCANWLGDSMSRWDHLEMSIPMSLGLGLSGLPFVGGDVGGFGENCDAELLVRWFQAAALTPFCRNHNDAGGVDQYPWSFGPEVEKICVDALRLRYRLMPYLYSLFVEASETGAPMMRPMVWADQEDPALRTLEDQYLLGPNLLVAPVIEKGSAKRRVRFPRGEWFDWWTGVPAPSRELVADAPLSRLPLYARAGSVIPMWPEAPPSTMGYRPETIDLLIFVPTEDGVFESRLVEDDGESFGYERGERLTTIFRLTRRGSSLEIETVVEGSAYPGFKRSMFRIHLRGAAPDMTHSIEASVEGFVWRTDLG